MKMTRTDFPELMLLSVPHSEHTKIYKSRNICSHKDMKWLAPEVKTILGGRKKN